MLFSATFILSDFNPKLLSYIYIYIYIFIYIYIYIPQNVFIHTHVHVNTVYLGYKRLVGIGEEVSYIRVWSILFR